MTFKFIKFFDNVIGNILDHKEGINLPVTFTIFVKL